MANDVASWNAQWAQLHPNEGVRPEGYHGEGGGGVTVGNSVTQPDYASILRQNTQLANEANKPVISSLQASIPEIQQKYAQTNAQLTAEKAPLETRYQNLLTEITRKEGLAVTDAQRTLSREYGRRGIPLASGEFEQNLTNTVNPIREAYSGQYQETGLAREDAIRQLQNLIANLVPQQTAEERAVQNAIANIQAGGSKDAITSALQLYQLQQNAATESAKLAAAEKVAASEAALSKNKYTTLSEGQTLYDPTTGRAVYTAPKTYAPGTVGNTPTENLALGTILGGKPTTGLNPSVSKAIGGGFDFSKYGL